MDTLSEVRALLLKRLPRGIDPATLVETTRLGSEGAGLDSIAMVELLLDCEQRFTMSISEEVLADGNLTLGSLVETVREQLAARRQA